MEILDFHSDQTSIEIFLIQNIRNRSSQAVLVSFDYFQELLSLMEDHEELLDQVMGEFTEERSREEGAPLEKVIKDYNIDLKAVYDMAEKIQLE